MKTTIARVWFTARDGEIFFQVKGTVVARGMTVEKPGVCSGDRLYPARWAYVFGSFDAGNAFALGGGVMTRKVRLTTLGYDRSDRVVTAS